MRRAEKFMRKPLSSLNSMRINVVACILVVILILGIAIQASAVDTKPKSTTLSQSAMKWDIGKKDLFASANADTTKTSSEKEEPLYVTLLSFIFKLAIVVALAYGTIYLLKRFSGLKCAIGGSSRRIKVVENTAIGSNRSLHLIEIGSKKLLVASTPNQISLLTEMQTEDIPETSSPEPISMGFKEQLSSFMGNKPDTGDSEKNVAQAIRNSSIYLQEKIMELGRMRRKFRDASAD